MQWYEPTVASRKQITDPPDAMTFVALAWGFQNIFHLVAFRQWLDGFRPLAWCLLALAVAVLLFPRYLRLFLAMLIANVAYYTIYEWPHVSNHVLIDSLINIVILGAAASVLRSRCFVPGAVSKKDRDRIFAMFAPVAGAIFVLMYYSIVLSKFNDGFFDLAISCMTAMYNSFLVYFPIFGLIASVVDTEMMFWLFMAIEILLPVLLTFRRTRLLAIYIGVPFHVLLGVMGHLSFSSLMVALYLIVAMPAFLEFAHTAARQLGVAKVTTLSWSLRGYAVLVLAVVTVSVLTGTYAKGPFGMTFNFGKLQWLIGAGLLGAGLIAATLWHQWRHGPFSGAGATQFWTWRPKWLWLMLLVVAMNSASPYIGFKTETSLAMYSNMRTEGGVNNHFFMPTFRIFDFPDDLVEVLDSNDPNIKAMRTKHILYGSTKIRYDILVTYFELRRAVSRVESEDLEITYRRDGEVRQFRRGAPSNPDPDLDEAPNVLLAKLAFFRPVFKGDNAYCLH